MNDTISIILIIAETVFLAGAALHFVRVWEGKR